MARDVYGKSGPAVGPDLPRFTMLSIVSASALEFYAEVLDHGGGNALALANQSEQHVLGADVFMVQSRRFLARHRENFSNALGEVVSVHGQRSAQLLLICLQSSQINLHFRQPTRRGAAVVARLGGRRLRRRGLDDDAGLNEWRGVAGRHSENESDAYGCDKVVGRHQ